jgi:hypothetical protein
VVVVAAAGAPNGLDAWPLAADPPKGVDAGPPTEKTPVVVAGAEFLTVSKRLGCLFSAAAMNCNAASVLSTTF